MLPTCVRVIEFCVRLHGCITCAVVCVGIGRVVRRTCVVGRRASNVASRHVSPRVRITSEPVTLILFHVQSRTGDAGSDARGRGRFSRARTVRLGCRVAYTDFQSTAQARLPASTHCGRINCCSPQPTYATNRPARPCLATRGPQVIDINAVHVNPARPWQLAVGGSDECVQLYDVRLLTSLTSSYVSAASPAAPRRGAATEAAAGGGGGRGGGGGGAPRCRVHGNPLMELCPAHLRPPPAGESSSAFRRPTHVTCVVFGQNGARARGGSSGSGSGWGRGRGRGARARALYTCPSP